jgi:hypothetical protein
VRVGVRGKHGDRPRLRDGALHVEAFVEAIHHFGVLQRIRIQSVGVLARVEVEVQVVARAAIAAIGGAGVLAVLVAALVPTASLVFGRAALQFATCWPPPDPWNSPWLLNSFGAPLVPSPMPSSVLGQYRSPDPFPLSPVALPLLLPAAYESEPRGELGMGSVGQQKPRVSLKSRGNYNERRPAARYLSHHHASIKLRLAS